MPAKAKQLDFTNVKERKFNRKHLPEGDYPARVKSVEDHKSKEGNDNWLFTLEITDGPGRGASYPIYCGLDADQLWKFRNLAVACGINVPKKRVNTDPNKLVGKACGITLEDEEYGEKTTSTVAATIPLSEVQSPDDEDEQEGDEEVAETPAPAKAKAGKAGKKDKKGKKAKHAVDDDELEELEVEDL
jgi:hypothetical protein